MTSSHGTFPFPFRRLVKILVVFFLLSSPSGARATTRVILKKIQVKDMTRFVRIRFLFKKNFPDKLASYQRGKTLTLLFRGTHNGLRKNVIPIQSNIAKDIRILRYNRGMRVVITLRDPNIEFVRYQMKSPPQVVVSLRRAKEAKGQATSKARHIPPPKAKKPKTVGAGKETPMKVSKPPVKPREAKKVKTPPIKPFGETEPVERGKLENPAPPNTAKPSAIPPAKQETTKPKVAKAEEKKTGLSLPEISEARGKKKSYYFLSSLPPGGDPDARQLFTKARKDFKESNYKDAAEEFKDVLNEVPDTREGETSAFYWARSLELGRQKPQRVIMAYETILKRFPDAPWAYEATRSLMSLYESRLEFTKAINLCRNLQEKYRGTPREETALFDTGRFLLMKRDYVKARRTFETYLRKYPKGKHVREATFYLGDASFYFGDIQQAVDTYESALKRWPGTRPGETKTLLNMATAFAKSGRYNQAINLLFDALNISPRNEGKPILMLYIAHLYEKHGKFREALIVYSKVKAQYPGTEEATESIKRMTALAKAHPEAKSRGF